MMAPPPFHPFRDMCFKVRIVYFDAANTIEDTEVQTRLGMQSRFDELFVGAPRVKRTGEWVHGGVRLLLAADEAVAQSARAKPAFVQTLLVTNLTRTAAHVVLLPLIATHNPGGATDSIVPVNMVTDSTQNNIFNRPVVQIVPPLAGVSILAQ